MGRVLSFENLQSGRRRYSAMAEGKMARDDIVSTWTALRSRRLLTRLETFRHENRETSVVPAAEHRNRTAGEDDKSQDPLARHRGVGQRRSTCDPFEQRQETVRGEWGGKAVGHYEQTALILEQRQSVLDGAYRAHPERFVRQAPKPPSVPTEVWIHRPANSDDKPH